MTYNYVKHITEDTEFESKKFSPNFRSNVSLNHNDSILAGRFMEAELACYNHIVTILGAQFNRDHTFYLTDIEGEDRRPSLYGQMCYTQTSVYGGKYDNYPDSVKTFKTELDTITDNTKYILSSAVPKNGHILPDVKKRMGHSILSFYMQQSQTKRNNKVMSTFTTNGDIQYTAPFDSLTPQTSFHKKHLQIGRNDIKIVSSNEICQIKIPYLNKPIEILNNQEQFLKSNWNYIILRQIDAQGGRKWIVDFKRVDKNFYFYKFTDRQGRSGLFEMNKRRY